MYEDPKVIRGGQVVDDRGVLTFCNDFHLAGVQRCYTVTNHRQGFVRAWHGHQKSGVFLWPMKGVWKVAAARIEANDRSESWVRSNITVHTLDPTLLLHVPAGHYNGHQNLTSGAVLGVFSTASLEEVREDDHRLPWDWWSGVWQEVPR